MLDVVTIGDSVVDIVIPVPHFPTGNEETVVSKGMTRHLGGSSNFLIMSSRLGMKTGVIDLIGDDDLGKFYKSNLDEERVDTSNLIIKNGKKTAHCICMVDDQGQHSYISFPGITSKLTQNDINPNYIKSSKNLYLSGYSLASSPIREATMKALDIATQNKVPVFFDPSPIVKRIPKQELHKVIKESQIVFLNERELNLITDSIHSFLKLGCETIVLKQGEKGCSVYHGTEIKHVDTFPTKVIDTTGAGDVFNAGFLLGMTKGWSFESCAKFGNAIAAIKVAKLGAGRNVPTQDEIKKFLELNDSSIPF